MLRLSPEGYNRFFQESRLLATFGGAEANVAVSLANYGLESAFVTKVPDNEIGAAAIKELRSFGVDTANVLKGGERLGIYYMEKGAAQRGSLCIYDRKYSAVSRAAANEFDWDKILEGATWFHFTGITPALSNELTLACEEALKAAKERGITISCDLNYRSKLWERERAGAVMSRLCSYVDVCIGNEEDAKNLFGIESEGSDITGGKLNAEGYKEVAKKLADRFGFRYVAITLRTSHSASLNDFAGLLYDGENFAFSKEHHIQIVDRVGGGDAFAAGLIYALSVGCADGGLAGKAENRAKGEVGEAGASERSAKNGDDCEAGAENGASERNSKNGYDFKAGAASAACGGRNDCGEAAAFDTQKAVEFAACAAVLKHSVEGDFNRVTLKEVMKLAGGDSSGRISR